MRSFVPLLALQMAACTAPTAEYRSILPDDRLLIEEDAFDDSALRGVGDPSDYYGLTRDTVRDTNQVISDVLGLIDAITAFDPTWSDDASGGQLLLWGPWLDDGVYGQLWVAQDADDSWTWAIEIRPEASAEDAWQGVLEGQVDAGASEAASHGAFQMDLTAIEQIAPDTGTLGQVSCEYDLADDAVSADVGFGGLSEDGSMPADLLYHYEQTPHVGGLMDLALDGDISDPPNGTAEFLIIRSRWQSDGRGRADAYVTGGDAGPLTYTETDCWDRGHRTVYLENNLELLSEGDPAKCAFDEPSFNESR